jgi:tetratricopeptide (TPR) repeat protein
LCELLYHQGRYGEAISRLEDFLNLYPQDPERVRSRFMLADAYRRSANALRREPPAGTSAKAAEVEARERLRTAADLFDALLREADNAEVKEHEALEVYTRLALFYRGDCLFDLNEPDTLQAALATYRNAAARYAGRPAALTAHVQIANIHLRQGDVVEAARAIEKARWLLRSIPDEAFVRAAAGDRKDWEEYLSVVSSSSLFREVFAGPR